MSEITLRSNLIWVFGDQHRAQALGYMGDPNLYTPNIDRLAAEGVTFQGAVGGCPLCGPYRGALLTGRYPHHSVPGHEEPLPEGMPTIAQPFNEAGYDTAWLGKWHVDGFKEITGRAAFHTVPRHRRGGFQTWLGYENNNSQWDCWLHGHDGEDREIDHYRLEGYETDLLTDLLIDYLREHATGGRRAEVPFFAGFSVQPPHNPYQAPERWMARHTPGQVQLRPNVPNIPWVLERARRELAGYYAMIENLDWNLGRIRQALSELGLEANTHVIFFSDHGDMHGSHGQFRKTAPYEESVQVPFIIGGLNSHYAGKTGQPQIPINHVDVGPTSLGLCGIKVPDWMAGTDYSAHRLRDQQPGAEEPDSAYLQLVIPTGHGDSTDRPWRGVVTRDGWKYICLEGQPWLMFNLREDPYEQMNLAHNSVYAQQRRKLQARLAWWIKETGDHFQLPDLETPRKVAHAP